MDFTCQHPSTLFSLPKQVESNLRWGQNQFIFAQQNQTQDYANHAPTPYAPNKASDK